jgi:hypothetical protein
MRGGYKQTAGRHPKFFARSVSGGPIPTSTAKGHEGSTPPSVAYERPLAGTTNADTIANGQFGRPSGQSGASPLSQINGALNGAGNGKLNTTVPGGYRGPYGKVRVR